MAYLKQIDNIFSEDCCKYLIKQAEELGMKKVEDRPGATYHRSMLKNKEMADRLFNQLRSHIPQTFNGQRVVGLNEMFRFSKYYPGGKFGIHKDGYNVDSQGNRSAMTLNIFLNDDFEGGETDFFYDDARTLRYSVKPKPGRGALFDSQQFHCGNTVKGGYKYLIRTDVMVSPF